MKEKKVLILSGIIIVLVGVVVSIAIFLHGAAPKEKSQVTTTLTSSRNITTTTLKSTRSTTVEDNEKAEKAKDAAYDSEEEAFLKEQSEFYEDKTNVLRGASGDIRVETGVAKTVLSEISSTERWYYFTAGVYDKSYTGVSEDVDLSPQLYYVKNGQVDTSFNGFVSYRGYMHLFKKGLEYKAYTGRVDLYNDPNLGPYHIEKGVLVDHDVGYRDNTILSYNTTYKLLDE